MKPSWTVFALLGALAATVPATGQSIVATLSRDDWQPRTVAVHEASNRVFVGDQPTGQVFVFDGPTLELLASPTVGMGVSALTVAQGQGKVYAYSIFDHKIAVLDAATGGFLHFVSGSFYNVFQGFMTVDEDLGALYVLSLDGLARIDVTNDSVTPIPGAGGGGFEGLGLNPVTHEVFVTRYIQNTLLVVDGMSLATTTVSGLGGAGNVGVNWVENKVYVSRGGGFGVPYKVYDRDSGTIEDVFADNDALLFTFDPLHNRVISDSEVNAVVTVIDADDSFTNVAMGQTVTGLDVLEKTGRVYLAGLTFVAWIDGETLAVTKLPVTNPHAGGGLVWQDLAIDQSRGRIYAIHDSDLPVVTVVEDSSIFADACSGNVFSVTADGTVCARKAFYCAQDACFNAGLGADVAERIETVQPLRPGDLVEIDPDREAHYRLSTGACSPRVVGAVAERPAVTLGTRRDDPASDDRPLLALMGRVRIRATTETGPIRPGELLVSASTPGAVMRARPADLAAGCLIGKALEALAGGDGTIEVLLMR